MYKFIYIIIRAKFEGGIEVDSEKESITRFLCIRHIFFLISLDKIGEH